MLTPTPEVSVLGSMLLDARCIPMLMQQLRPEDFPTAELRSVFEAMRALFLERRVIDPVTVLDRLGSPGYAQILADLAGLTPSSANVREYARLLREGRQLREIQEACIEICSAGISLADAREMLAKAAGLLVQAQSDRDRSYSDLVADYIKRQQDDTPPDHLDWGIPALNEKLQLGLGNFVVIGADSSVGKTALALQLALAIARSGKKVGFFSYETTLQNLTDRLVANDADVSLGRSKGKRLRDEEIDRVLELGRRSKEANLRILETARYTVADIRAKCLAWGFQVIFVDYVQLIPTRAGSRYEAVTEISMGLHAIAQELGVTVVGLSQVTVPETDKRGDRRYISMQDLRESRQLKQDAEAILLLDLSDPKDRDSNRVLQIEKNKDGPQSHLLLSFDSQHMRFSYVPPFEDQQTEEERRRWSVIDRNRELRRVQAQAKSDDRQQSFADYAPEAGEEVPF